MMSEQDKTIHNIIKKGKKRICQSILFRFLVIYLSIGLACGTIINFISYYIPIYHAVQVSGIMILAIILLGFMIAVFQFPNEKKVAGTMDHHGLEQRLTTSLELREREDAFSQIQKKDTIQKMEHFFWKQELPIRVPTYQVFVLVLTMLVFIITAVIPSPLREVAKAKHELQIQAKENVDKIEKVKKEFEKIDQVESLEKAELDKILQQGLEELKQATDTEALEKAMKRLETKLNQAMQKQEQEVAKKMEKIIDLAELTQKTEKEKLSKEFVHSMEEVLEDMKLSKEELEELVAQMSEAELKEGMEQLEQALSDGSMDENEQAQLAKQLQNANASISLSQNHKANQNQSNSQSNSGEETSSSQKNTSGTKKQDGNSNGQESSANESTGQKNGNGQGSGSGNGMGEGNQGGSQGGNAMGGSKNYGGKNGFEKEITMKDSKEKVMVPDRDIGNDSNLKGEIHEDGNGYVTKSEESLTWSGNKVEYNQVILEYSEQAYSKIENNQVPKGMEDVVKSYFEAIHQ